jgi:pyridoxine 4-dehydrogenase
LEIAGMGLCLPYVSRSAHGRQPEDTEVSIVGPAPLLAFVRIAAEELIHEALHPWPEHVRIATKAGMARTGPDQWVPLGRPEYLRRLGVERIDLFQLHRVDPEVPAAEQYGLLGELRAEGKVAEVGLSEVSVTDIEEARAVVPVVSVQSLFNLARRQAEDVLGHCEANGIAFIPWFPLASGRLAEAGGPLDDVARTTGASMSQVALAWLLKRSPVMMPIPGTSSLAHLEDNCGAAGVELSDEQFGELEGARKSLRRWALT